MMNRMFSSKRLGALLLGTAVVFSSPVANAQLGDAGEILKAGAADANKLLEAYLNPFGQGFGAGLNTGWFTSAKTHGVLGFDIMVNAALVTVPTSALSMNINSLGLSQLTVTGGSPDTPTISGGKDTDTKLGIYYTNPVTNTSEILTEFDMPAGIGFEYVPSPMAQVTVGIIKDTDVSLRFIPETAIGDFGDIGLIGFGVKHGLNQWLPGGKLIPVDISLQFGYTSLSMSAGFDVQPESGADIKNTYPASQWEGQGVEFSSTGYTINAIAGKKLPFVGGYVGIGYEASKTSISTPGFYPVTSVNPDYHPITDPHTKRIEAIEAPIDIEFTGENSFRAFAGIQVQLAVIKLFANYTASNYSSVNGGIGITFR